MSDPLRQAAERGRHAGALLEDDLLKESLDYIVQSYTDAWKWAKTPELREKAWDLVQAGEKFREHLTTVLTSGRLADEQVRELVRRDRRAA